MDEMAFFGRHRTILIAALVAGPALFGCSSSDRLKKQVAGLETQLTLLRADQDRAEERLSALELSSNVAPHAAPTAAVERVERPRLKIIHLSPDDEEPTEKVVEAPPTGASDSAGRRPIIRGTGDRVIKVGDGDSDETTGNEVISTKRVADLGKDSRGN